MPVGICKLCMEEKDLQNSHLIPRSLYRPLRNTEERNQNPVVLTLTASLRTSRQTTDYLLCWDCEQLFSRNGEDWVSRRAYNGETFPLWNILMESEPVWPGDETFGVYSGASIKAIDMDKLVYFAMSIFWRASVHEWRFLDERICSRLDEFEEPVRQYLRGGPFPADAALHIMVSSNPQPFRSMFVSEGRQGRGSARSHHFMISGILFVLHLGDIHPTDRLMCAQTSERRYIYTAPAVDDFNAAVFADTFASNCLSVCGHGTRQVIA